MPATTPTTRMPAATSTRAIAIQTYPKVPEQAVDGEPGHHGGGAEPGGPVETDALHERVDERAAGDQDDDLRQHADGGERGRPAPVELQLQRDHVAEAGGREPGGGLVGEAAGDEGARRQLQVEERVAGRALAQDEQGRRRRWSRPSPPTGSTTGALRRRTGSARRAPARSSPCPGLRRRYRSGRDGARRRRRRRCRAGCR